MIPQTVEEFREGGERCGPESPVRFPRNQREKDMSRGKMNMTAFNGACLANMMTRIVICEESDAHAPSWGGPLVKTMKMPPIYADCSWCNNHSYHIIPISPEFFFK